MSAGRHARISFDTVVSDWILQRRQISETIKIIKDERTRIIKKLRESGAFDVFDSKANFVLFDARGADSESILHSWNKEFQFVS